MIIEAQKRSWITKNHFIGYNADTEKIDQVYLTPREVHQIMSAEMTSDHLKRVRDLFILQCFVGLSYCDLKSLSEDDFQKTATGKLMIIKDRQKTEKTSRIPVLKPAQRIIDKYKVNAGRTLFNLSSDQKVNEALKDVAILAGIKKNLTTHVARRSAATLMMFYGVDAASIVKALGHSSFAMLHRYASMQDEKLQADFDILDDKLEAAFIKFEKLSKGALAPSLS